MAEVSWGGFAAPTPEAENWQPDPDSIPVAGGLPDLRLNKHPLTTQQKQALKRDKLLGLYCHGHNESNTVTLTASSASRSSSSTRAGNWPAAVPRATGHPGSLVPSIAHPLFSPCEATVPAGAAIEAAEETSAPVFKSVTTSKPTGKLKGTMETLPLQPLFQRPQTPPTSTASEESESPAKTPTPAWARKFEHLLRDSSSSEADTNSAPLNREHASPPAQAAPVKSSSRPPHLRKQQSASTAPTLVAALRSRSSDLEATGALQEKLQPTAPPKVLPSSSVSHSRNLSEVTDSDATNLVKVSSLDVMTTYANANATQNIAVQKRLLESFIPKRPSPTSDDHECYLKGKLVSALEEGMGMSQRTTRRELHNMNDAELETNLTKVKAMHKLSWEFKQRRDRNGGLDVRASLSAFQEKERERFKRNDGCPEARYSERYVTRALTGRHSLG